MLLQRLSEYADRLDATPRLYNSKVVRYIIELDGDGRLRSRHLTDTADPSSRSTIRGVRRLVPDIARSSGIKPILFADNAVYTFGIAREKDNLERVAEQHREYVALVRRCAEETGNAAVAAVSSFLEGLSGTGLDLSDGFDASANVTFSVDSDFVVDLPAVRDFWARENDPEAGGATKLQCLVCGEIRPVLDRMEGRLKGIPGGQTSGTALISANSDAFESYGLKNSLIAPTCAQCGERFTKAANDLLAGDSTHIVVGGSVFIFWTRSESAFSPRTFVDQPSPEDVRQLIAAAHGRGRGADVQPERFFAAALGASGGRAVLRDWLDTTVPDVQRNLARWFQTQSIVGDWGEAPEARYFGVWSLASATVRETKDLAPHVAKDLMRNALYGSPLSLSLVFEAVRRNRAEQGVRHARAALIKLVLAPRFELGKDDALVYLNLESSQPAYRCGRLLSVLEAVQKRALRGINQTIVDRFFGTASSAPASVFGRLLRGSQPHLAKLARDQRGAHIRFQRQLEEIQSGLSAFPRILTLEEQGLFALGYYHQRAHDRAQAIQAGEAKRARLASQETSVDDDDEPSTLEGEEK